MPRESAFALAGNGERGRHASRLPVHVRGTLARGLSLQLMAEVVISPPLTSLAGLVTSPWEWVNTILGVKTALEQQPSLYESLHLVRF